MHTVNLALTLFSPYPFVAEILAPYIWCQNFGDKSIPILKKETIVQDLLDFLGLSQNQLAEFFNISRTLFTRSALGTRKFPFRLNQRRLDMLNLMARMKAEKASQPEEKPIRFSSSFVPLSEHVIKANVRPRIKPVCNRRIFK
jgi:hypothetical protein